VKIVNKTKNEIDKIDFKIVQLNEIINLPVRDPSAENEPFNYRRKDLQTLTL
jgi:hypothetical protein